MKEKSDKILTKQCFFVAIATGTKYDLATNVSVLDGMTNGAECIVENIDYRVADSTRPSIT